MQQGLFSNYGGWVNLTAGVTADSSYYPVPTKSELAVSGNTVHFVWAENEGEDAGPNSYRVLYRRSTDGGVTWEDARTLGRRCLVKTYGTYEWDGYSNMMQVSGNTVHVLVPYNYDSHCVPDRPAGGELHYYRSTDGGATFSTIVLDTAAKHQQKVLESIIRVEGENIVIAARKEGKGDTISIYRSIDGGETFSRSYALLISGGIGSEQVAHLGGLEMVNGHWALLSSGGNGGIYVSTGTMQSDEIATTQLIANIYHSFSLKKLSQDYIGGMGDVNYHSLLAMPDENTLHVLIAENVESNSHLYYMRSTDGGATWSAMQPIADATATHSAIVAKGQNIYAVVGGATGRRWIAYSHDGGDTWGANKTMSYGTYEYDSPYSYDIVLDPNDPTGNHAWYIGSMGLDIETRDGFQTLSRANHYDGYLRYFMGDGRRNNFSPLVTIDSNGIRHLAMRTVSHSNPGAFSTFYRKETPEPAPANTNMAFHNRKPKDEYPHQRIVLPMTDDLAFDSAMTVGFWIRIDSLAMNTNVISLRTNTPETSDDQQVQEYWHFPGWSIGFESKDHNGLRVYPKAFICTDKAVDGGTKLMNYAYDDSQVYMAGDAGIWHYIAFTWNGREYDNNTHLYMDGMLLRSATVLGTFERGSNPIAIGDWMVWQADDRDWYMDELQLWRRALTHDEVIALSQHQPVSQEGCVVNLGFDGTLKDLSGHGNDAVAQLDCDLVEYEGLQLPTPKMQITRPYGSKTISFSDQTEGGEAVYWYFDDPELPVSYSESGSTLRHPQHTYSAACTVHPMMVARGANACAPYTQELVISGIAKVEPSVVGQSGGVNLRIIGGLPWGPAHNYSMRLHKEGQHDIHGVLEDGTTNLSIALRGLRARFDLSEAEVGQWDVIVGGGDLGTTYDTLRNGLTIEPLEYPDVWATVSGSPRFLVGRSKDYYIEYGNRSNANAYNVPFYLYIPDYVDVELGFATDRYPEGTDPELAAALDSIGDYVVFDAGEYGQMRCYSFLIPYIEAHSRGAKRFLIKSGQDIHMFWAIDHPWGPLDYDENGEPVFDTDETEPVSSSIRRMPMAYGRKGFSNDQIECMMNFLGWGTIDAVAGSIPFVGCAYGIGKTAIMGVADKPKDRWGNLFTNTLSTAFSCAMDFNPLGWGWRACTLASFAFNTAMNIYSAQGCGGGDGDDCNLYGVSSYDPNEMIGPKGFSDVHYMKPAPEMSYTVTFENKSSATAPAHEVFINDTLPADRFDFSTFGFTSFGWADTTVFVDGQQMKEFVEEVDLRPARNLIVRVSGTFNDSTGIAKWSFVSLDPETMDYAEEVDDGFLLPNDDNHVGEGFVSFGVNHLADLANGTTIANEATIIFDANAAIRTNTYVNTLDIDLPESHATSVTLVGDSLLIEWTATDATSGAAYVNLYVSKNDSAFELVEPLLRGNSYKMAYSADTTYCFATIAVDNVNWREDKAESDLTCEATFLPEGIETMGAAKLGGSRKELLDGRLYIILPDGRRYNAVGAEVR
ncbi:MAG: hypothetical protein IJ581_06055 [Paludibacteraceae bacterium]|nr:hypothetical protein [Paludibacteraceae bacterium]